MVRVGCLSCAENEENEQEEDAIAEQRSIDKHQSSSSEESEDEAIIKRMRPSRITVYTSDSEEDNDSDSSLDFSHLR